MLLMYQVVIAVNALKKKNLFIEMLSRYPCFVVSIGLILSGFGCLVSLNNNNTTSILIYIGLLMIVIGIIWDVYIPEVQL